MELPYFYHNENCILDIYFKKVSFTTEFYKGSKKNVYMYIDIGQMCYIGSQFCLIFKITLNIGCFLE